ncbi:hypothetical protein B0I37DRAFT_364495 [Chaetomium sp. MPI-CAGE-AT-0009]|nr:hypothetical protein B0I37DRAFT_364495 [Chaetomium sp. MPI-CAGE-AT-0009]
MKKRWEGGLQALVAKHLEANMHVKWMVGRLCVPRPGTRASGSSIQSRAVVVVTQRNWRHAATRRRVAIPSHFAQYQKARPAVCSGVPVFCTKSRVQNACKGTRRARLSPLPSSPQPVGTRIGWIDGSDGGMDSRAARAPVPSLGSSRCPFFRVQLLIGSFHLHPCTLSTAPAWQAAAAHATVGAIG